MEWISNSASICQAQAISTNNSRVIVQKGYGVMSTFIADLWLMTRTTELVRMQNNVQATNVSGELQ